MKLKVYCLFGYFVYISLSPTETRFSNRLSPRMKYININIYVTDMTYVMSVMKLNDLAEDNDILV